MSQGAHGKRRFDAVLVIETDALRRVAVEWAFLAAGFTVRAVSSIAEVEQWPDGQLVITDTAHLSPFWRQVGAVEVVALVANAEEASTALSKGATLWLQLPSDAAVVATTLLDMVSGAGGSDFFHTLTSRAEPKSPPPR